MADQRLEEYRKYYEARAARYANNPNHRHAFEAESKLSALFKQFDTIDEIGKNMGTLNIDCAFAAWRDQYEMESNYYGSVSEPIRKKCADQILAEISKTNDLTQASSAINEITDHCSTEQALDEANGNLLAEWWAKLDDIEAYANAQVPDEYKSDMLRMADTLKSEMRESLALLAGDKRTWQPDWQIDPSAAQKPQYRAQLPYSDEEIARHIAQFNGIANK